MNRIENYRYVVAATAITIMLFLSGCMGSYGRIKSNPDLTDAFKNNLKLPDYNYYYCGRENLPYAVVGIDPQYEFQDSVWFKIETKADVYKKAASITAWDRTWSRGADILDPEGNRIGIWFSYYSSTSVKVGPDNKVAVFNPYRPGFVEAGQPTP